MDSGNRTDLTGLLAELQAQCRLPVVVSPHLHAADGWLPGWLRRCGLPPDTTAHRRLAGAQIGGYAARLYPAADLGRLRLLTALFAWFFLNDDEFDQVAEPQQDRLHRVASEILALLRTGQTTGADARSDAGPDSDAGPVFVGPARRMLTGPWRVLVRTMPPWWRERFVDAVAEHLDGAVREARNKATGHRPDPAEYVELRRATSAANVAYTLIEFATGEPVPDAVFHHPRVRELADTGNDLLSWYNDLYSLPGDLRVGGGHNLVVAVAEADRIPLAAAVDLVAGRWRAQLDLFAARRAAVPSFGPAYDRAAAALLDGIGHAVRGTIDWSAESGRYRPPGRGGRAGEPGSGP
ncbi:MULTISPECIES: terpene synthase family protein [unclassified Solwaraspora]|uniref:terpene synthase family protein n=1 Tax=unclassified Solwaraspora TaxID=2627926 RepID=UPI00259B0B49|nr:terpene synthase family protein [Solwaraspora sp. WMMA2056]WJK41908.1 terpene synthase family protein [Solwaraspora sp. WMMA2056]